MKTILLLAGITTLLTTSGCLVAEDGHRGYYGHHETHVEAVVVAPRPVVVVREPVLVVRPPEIIVR